MDRLYGKRVKVAAGTLLPQHFKAPLIEIILHSDQVSLVLQT